MVLLVTGMAPFKPVAIPIRIMNSEINIFFTWSTSSKLIRKERGYITVVVIKLDYIRHTNWFIPAQVLHARMLSNCGPRRYIPIHFFPKSILIYKALFERANLRK